MITETELRDALVRQAKTYEVPPHDLLSLRAAALRRRRDTRLRYGGLAAAVLLAAGVAWGQLGADQAVTPPADGRSDVTVSPSCAPPGQAPLVPDSPEAGAGFVSDEPVTATTTATATEPGGRSCTLVLRYGFHRLGAGAGFVDSGGCLAWARAGCGPGLSGMVFLYSDGRLIVDTDEDSFVQWERRLTPEGVERVRTAVVAMLDESAGRPGGSFEIHYGDGTFYPKNPQALVRLLIDRSWLPDEDWVTESASIYRAKDWVTESPSIYRAAWYLTCYEMRGRHGPDVEAAVRDLPSGARDVLESRGWTPLPSDPESGVLRSLCVVLSRADATVLVEALGGDITVGKAHVFKGGLGGPARHFSVHALMPDGTSGAHGD